MGNFYKWLSDKVLSEMIYSSAYIDPDYLYFNGNHGDYVTFIYTAEHKLYTTKTGTHNDLITRTPELLERYHKFTRIPSKLRMVAEEIDLFGRVGKVDDPDLKINNKVVSFWDSDLELYDKLMQPCIQALCDKKFIDKYRDYVSTPNHKTIKIADLNRINAVELDNEEKEKIALQKKMHLMVGAEKRAAMKELGVGYEKKEHPWQAALKNARIIPPGANWKYPYSEYKL